MTRTATVVVGLIVLLLAVPAGAQDSQGTVTRYYLTTVKAGHDLKWEQAFKAHVDWHRQQNDTWAWDTYMLVTGERLGQYITISTSRSVVTMPGQTSMHPVFQNRRTRLM